MIKENLTNDLLITEKDSIRSRTLKNSANLIRIAWETTAHKVIKFDEKIKEQRDITKIICFQAQEEILKLNKMLEEKNNCEEKMKEDIDDMKIFADLNNIIFFI